ncbi:MAG: hypothetical protein JF609_07620 [Verrucomicrobia bacterium]|nr:hypothetical protein [Verrucomicrobiota bacterium]
MSQINVRNYALGVPPYHPQDPWPHHTNYCDGVFGILAASTAIGSIGVNDLCVNGTNIVTVQTNAYSTDCVNKSSQFEFTVINNNPNKYKRAAVEQRSAVAAIPTLVEAAH